MATTSSDSKTGTYMTDFEKQVIETLTELKTLIMEDHKLLRGNGHPGLLDRVAALESNQGVVKNFKDIMEMAVSLKADVEILKQKQTWWRSLITTGIAAVSAAVAVYCAFLRS